MKKSIISFTLAIITLLLLSVSISAAKPFNDVQKTHWAYKYINPMVDKGVINGYDGNVFKPNGNVTRAEWAKLLAATAGIPTHENYKEIMENACLDARASDWHAPYTVALIPYFDYTFKTGENGEKYFNCESSKAVTRLEIAKSIIKVADFDTDKANLDYIKGFRDYSSIPTEDRKYVAVAVEKGIINGFDDNTFRPDDKVTRAQAATMLHRTFYGEIYEIEQPEKPYIIEKLVGNVKITSSIEATLDESGNFYYINSNDGLIYVYDLDKGKAEPWCDPRDLKYEAKISESGNMEYLSEYVPVQLFYDRFNDKLLINGYYSTIATAGKAPKNGYRMVLYDITEGDAKFYCFVSSIDERFPATIQAVFNKDSLYMENNSQFVVDIHSGNMILTGRDFSGMVYNGSDENEVYQNFDNALYYISYRGDYFNNRSLGNIFKYNPSEGKFQYLVDNTSTFWYNGIGILPGYYYYYNSREETMYRINLKTKMVDTVSLTFANDKVEITDMGTLTKINARFYMIDETSLIFYDYNMSAFRILRENTVEIPEFVAPVFNRDAYFKALEAYNANNYKKQEEAPSSSTSSSVPNEITDILSCKATVVDCDTEIETTLSSLVKLNSSYLKTSVPESYAVCDITGDGTAELLVQYSFNGGTAIICKHNGKWIANYAPSIKVVSMSSDGYSSFTNGNKSGLEKPCFVDGRLIWMTILEMNTEDTDNIKYTYNDKNVSFDEYKTAYNKIKTNETPIVWIKL